MNFMTTKSNSMKRMKTGILAGLGAGLLCVTAQAGIFTTFTTGSEDSPVGEILPGGSFSLGSQQNLIGQGLSPIWSIELVLTFNDPGALAANGSGIQGLLTLGTGPSSPYVAFNPVQTSISPDGNVIYDVTFTTFNGLNPNNIWSLNLWDNNANIGNELLSWSMIVEVPEPIDVALGVFGVMFVAIIVVRRRAARLASQRQV